MALSESRRLPPLYRQPTDLHVPSSSLSHRKRARSPEPSLFLSPLEEETLNRVVPPKHSTTAATAAPVAPTTTTYGAGGGGATAHRRVDPSSLSSPSPLVDSTWLQRNINRFVSLFVRYSTAASATSSSPSRRTVGPSFSSSVVKGPTATATVVPQPLPPANSTTTVLLTPLKRKAPAADPPPSSVTKKVPSAMQQQKNATVPSSWESPVRPTVGGNRSKLAQQHRSAFPYGSATLSQTQRNQTSRTLPLDEVPSTPQLSGLNHDYIIVDDDDEEQRPGRAKYLIDDVLSVAQLARLVPSLRVAGPSATSSSSTASPTAGQATKKRVAEAEKLAAYIREDVAMREIYDAVVEEAVQKIVSTRAVRCSALLSALTESIVSHALRATLSRHIPRKAGVLRSLRLQQRQRQRLSENPPQHRPTTASVPFVMELDEEDRQYVSRVFSRGSDLTPVIERDGFKILRNQLGTLNGTQWVNDQVINYYFHLLSQQRPASYPVVRDLSLQPGTPRPDVLSLGSHVYTRIAAGDVQGALRWVRRQESIFDCRVVLVPINLNNTHWSLVVVHHEGQRLEYYDSMESSERRHGAEILRNVAEYMQAAWDARHPESLAAGRAPTRTTKGGEVWRWSCWHPRRLRLPASWDDKHNGCDRAAPPALPTCRQPHSRNYREWPLVIRDDVPRQGNGYDCGVFVCMFGLCASMGTAPDHVSQQDVTNMREVLPIELLEGSVLIRSAL